MYSKLPKPYHISTDVILYLILFTLPIRWVPGIPQLQPLCIPIFLHLMMASYCVIVLIKIFLMKTIKISNIKLYFSSIILSFILISYSEFSSALILLFGISVGYDISLTNKEVSKYIDFFVIWITLLSAFSLLVTFSPYQWFELNVPLYENYRDPLTYFDHPRLKYNSFGFYGKRDIYVLTSIALIFSIFFMVVKSIKLYLTCSTILLAQLINIFYLTGSGRSAFVLPLFVLIVIIVVKLNFIRLIPYLVLSPLILWIILFLLKTHQYTQRILSLINEFTSNRAYLYIDSLQIIFTSSKSIFGLGPQPWGNIYLSELGIQNTFTPIESKLIRPHNFLLEFTLEFGIISGFLLLYICIVIANKSISIFSQEQFANSQFSILAFLTGSIFVGLLIGGKSGPYSVNYEIMILWWLCFGTLIASHRHT